MNFILSVSAIGVSACILLGILFLAKGKGKLISNGFLGVFFLLLAIRLGKLVTQQYAPEIILNTYFNLMHSAYLAIGPVVWFYIQTYLSPITINRRNKLIHFIPSLIFLVGAFHLRQISGESIWVAIYWITQSHPVLYVFLSLKFLLQSSHFKKSTAKQRIWLFSILGAVLLIALMSILYFTLSFPFYLVTALLSIVTVYLICFLAFNNKLNVLIGKSDQKYKNLNLDSEETSQLHEKLEVLFQEEQLYLDNKLRLSDISGKLDSPSHVISRVINEVSGKSFPQYVNHLRIERAKEHLLQENDKKVIAIAFESGFRSLSVFNRVFKEISGLNPSEYRTKYSIKKVSDL